MSTAVNPENATLALEEIYPQIMTKIQFELWPSHSKAEKQAKGQSGFVRSAARWGKRTFNAWVEICKSLVKNLIAHSLVQMQTQALLYQTDALKD